jgi:hypothetical protein
MSMTLRLTEEQDRPLQAFADAQGVSKQEAVVRALEFRAERLTREEQVRASAGAAIERYGPLLDRSAQ